MAQSGLHAVARRAFSRQALSYLFDWVVLALFAIGAAVLNIAKPRKRDFSLSDPSISYPYLQDTISIGVAFVIAVVAPAVIILFVCLFLVRIPPKKRGEQSNRTKGWLAKLWELHVGWLGLFFSLIVAFILTQALKNLFGKPRPDFLLRCDPDLELVTQFRTGFNDQGVGGAPTIVNWQICRSKSGSGVGEKEFWDGFRSFPSGHCSIAFSGLVYLSFFLATKLSAYVPISSSALQSHAGTLDDPESSPYHKRSAAPPLWTFVLASSPTFAAMYIATTRYSDYKHSGFDVLASSIGGSICAWLGFRWYHPSMNQGNGWAWGPRDETNAFWKAIGIGKYTSPVMKREMVDGEEPAADIEQGLNGSKPNRDMELQYLSSHRPAGSGSSQHRLMERR